MENSLHPTNLREFTWGVHIINLQKVEDQTVTWVGPKAAEALQLALEEKGVEVNTIWCPISPIHQEYRDCRSPSCHREGHSQCRIIWEYNPITHQYHNSSEQQCLTRKPVSLSFKISYCSSKQSSGLWSLEAFKIQEEVIHAKKPVLILVEGNGTSTALKLA